MSLDPELLKKLKPKKPNKSFDSNFDPPGIKKATLLEILSRSVFESKLKNWEIDGPYFEKIYSEYVQDESFRIAMNDFIHYGGTYNEKFYNYITNVKKKEKNFIIEIYGEIRIGKSRAARKIIKMYVISNECYCTYFMDPNDLSNSEDFFNNKDNQDQIKTYITYNFDDSLEMVTDKTIFNKGDINFQDEMPFLQGENSMNIMKQLKNIIKQSSGKRQINYIFLNPTRIEMENIHYYILILGVNKQNFQTIAMISIVNFKGKHEFKGILILDVREPEKLTIYYEINSDRIKYGVQENQGISNIDVARNKQKYVKILLEKVKEAIENGRNITTKDGLISFAMEVDEVKKRKGKDFKYIVSDVYEAYIKSKKYNEDKEEEKSDIDYIYSTDENFKVIMKEVYDYYIEKGKQHTREERANFIEWYKYYHSNEKIKQDHVAQKFQVDQSYVSIICGRTGELEGIFNKYIGELYEIYSEKKLKKIFEGKAEVIRFGGEGEPDIVIEYFNNGPFEVRSCKCYLPSKNRKTLSIPIKKVLAEIKYCRELKKKYPDRVIKCFLQFYDRLRSQEILKPMNFLEKYTPKSILVKLI